MGMKKAELYQETSSRPLNSLVILGMAVVTIVRSRDTRKILSTRARTMETSRSPVGIHLAPHCLGPAFPGPRSYSRRVPFRRRHLVLLTKQVLSLVHSSVQGVCVLRLLTVDEHDVGLICHPALVNGPPETSR